MSEERLTFKEMCARFDVRPRTLRYYRNDQRSSKNA